MTNQPRRPGRPATGKTPTRSMRLGPNYDRAKAKAEAHGETITHVIERALREYVMSATEIAEITILPQDIEQVFSEGRKVWRTDNQGGTWTLTAYDLSLIDPEWDGEEPDAEQVRAFAADLNERKPWLA